MGGETKKEDERVLALLPLPPIMLFALLLNLNDRAYLTTSQHMVWAAGTIILCAGIYYLIRSLLRRSEALKRLFKAHGPYILLLLLLILVKFYVIVSSRSFMFTEIIAFSDYMFMKHSMTTYHQLPLWNMYIWSGSPSHAIPDKWLYFPPLWPFVFLPAMLGMNLIIILTVSLGGILMYSLVAHLSKSGQAGLVSALVFVFSAFFMFKSQYLLFWQIFPLAHIPAIFFCLVKLTGQKRFVGFLRWGAATGLLMGSQLLSGTPEYFLYTLYFITGVYFAVSFLSSQRLRKALPSLVVAGILIIVLASSISAIKILPSLKFMKMTNRGGQWGGEDNPTTLGLGTPLNIFRFLARSSWTQLGKWGLDGKVHENGQVIYQNEEVGEIGLIGFLLALMALSRIQKRHVLALSATALIAVMMLNAPIYNLFRTILPMMDRFHVQGRILLLFVFAGAVLSGIGWDAISNRIPKRWLTRAFLILVSLMILDLVILGHPLNKTTPFLETLKENHILTNLSEQEGLFRIASFQVVGIDFALQPVTVPLGIQYNQGLDGLIWINDYWEYLAISHTQRSRFWGLLNIKYATSNEPVDEPGFELEQTFEECTICDYPDLSDDHFDGPYLYKNTEVLPRAYTVDNAILVAGDWDAAKKITYPLLAHEAFNPETTAIIQDSRSLSDVPRDELLAYKAIIPTSRLSNSDLDTLRDMKDAGIVILPDLFAGESGISEGQVRDLLEGLGTENAAAKEVEIPFYTPNKVIIGPVTTGKFLVLAEKYSLFPGDWKASVGNAPAGMLRANALGTAIPIANIQDETVTFLYRPPLFLIGALLSLAGLLAGVMLIWQPLDKSLGQGKEAEERQKKDAA